MTLTYFSAQGSIKDHHGHLFVGELLSPSIDMDFDSILGTALGISILIIFARKTVLKFLL